MYAPHCVRKLGLSRRMAKALVALMQYENFLYFPSAKKL